MATSIGLWSLVVSADEEDPTEFSPPADVRITNVALGADLEDENGRTSLKLIFPTQGERDSDDEEEEEEDDDDDDDDLPLSTTVLCSLTPGKIEQATLDLVVEKDDVVLFQVVGKNTLYLTGNYVSQPVPDDMPPFSDDESEEEDFDLRDVSSDVELDPSALEVPSDEEAELAITSKAAKALEETTTKSKKRARESDISEAAATPVATADGEGEKLSKSQKKKLNKKLKTETGDAVPTGEETPAAAPEVKKKEKKEKEKAAKPVAEIRELPGGLKVKDAKTGSGKVAKKGNTVNVRYIGKLENGKIFDQNTKGKPFSFNLGAGEVIKGWDQGVVGMQVGGERVLTVPASLAYGKRKQGDIPANSTLIFEVKLLDVK